ncbi:GTPase [Flagellimonas sp.]|uniref:GTPase n=1 Tax=Flagellimonas sp. TaxID=2058762 RepID=UPI003B507E6F
METEKELKLVFVYNADSGVHNAILDSMRKVFSPSTYDCNLCDITFGIVSENDIWKKFREESQHEMVFLHKDEFAKMYASKFGHKFIFPIVLAENGNELEVLISTKELNGLKTAEELVHLVKKRT